MPKRIYVGKLPGKTSEKEVKKMFGKFGNVRKVEFQKDGSAMVEMESGADEAIKALNKKEMGGKSLNVNEA